MGYLDNTAREVWSLTTKYPNQSLITLDKIKDDYKLYRKNSNSKSEIINGEIQPTKEEEEEEYSWQNEILGIIRSMHPSSLERFTQNFLRGAGFTNVRITKQTRDGGFDGE